MTTNTFWSQRAVNTVLLALFVTIGGSSLSSKEIPLKNRLIHELPRDLKDVYDAEDLSVWIGLGGTAETKLAFLTREQCVPEMCYSHIFVLAETRTQYIMSTFINFAEPFSKSDAGLAILNLVQKKWENR